MYAYSVESLEISASKPTTKFVGECIRKTCKKSTKDKRIHRNERPQKKFKNDLNTMKPCW